MARPIPDGFTSVTPHLIIDGCDKEKRGREAMAAMGAQKPGKP
jgi:hypothetical protein